MAGILIYSDNTELAADLCGFSTPEQEDITALAFDGPAAEALSTCGAKTVVNIEAGKDAIPESYAKSIAAFVREKGYGLVIVGATPRGRDLAARLAGYLDCGYGADVSNLAYDGSTISYERFNFGGNVVSHEHIDGLGVVTVGKGAIERVSGPVATVETASLEADGREKLVERIANVSEGVDIAAADRVVGVGMGLSSEDELKLAEDLAAALGGAVACSRGVAEERGWLPVDRYLGISGKVITPQLYLALGISGQVQHLYGVRDAKVIVAVDKDEKAPIMRNADYCIVGDLKDYTPLLTEAMKAR